MAHVPKRSSRLIFNERPLLIPPSLAVAIGLNEAVFVQQLHYWLNESSAGRVIEGRRWIYNTYEEWLKQFPFWSVATLRRVIGGLEKDGLVLSTQEFNEHAADRTKWYSLDYDAIDAMESSLFKSAGHVINVISPSDQAALLDVINVSSSIKEHESSTENTQEIVLSKGTPPVVDEGLVRGFISDYAREFHDEAPVGSSVARAVGLWVRAGVDEAGFVAALYEARRRTQRYSGVVLKVRADGRKNKMPYFFSVLEDLLKGKAR